MKKIQIISKKRVYLLIVLTLCFFSGGIAFAETLQAPGKLRIFNPQNSRYSQHISTLESLKKL